MKESLRKTLQELTALDGVAGFEQDVVRYLRDALTPLADHVEVDPMGNLYALRKGVPTTGLGLARRYSHTPVCTLDLNDAVGAVRVLEQFVRDMGEHTDLGFFA